MPRRTNPFQKLTTWLQDSLVGFEAAVTESAMVLDHRASKQIEVDVLIEFKKGGMLYRAAVECRDHARKAGPPWIRELRTKREDCKLDKIAAVHSMGFTAPAVKLASAHNILLYVLGDIPTDQADASLALKYFGGPMVSHSILGVGLGIVGLDEDEEQPESRHELYLADGKTTVPVHELVSDLLQDRPPPHDQVREGRYSDLHGTLPLESGKYFVKCNNRLLEVRQLLIKVRLFKSMSVTGSTGKRLTSVEQGNVVGEISAATIPGPGGLWTCGVAVNADTKAPQLFYQIPSGINPLDVRATFAFTYRDKGSDEIKHAKIPGKLKLLDKDGSPIPLFEFSVAVKSIDHDGPPSLHSEDVLGFYFADKKKSIDLNRLIVEEIRKFGLPDENVEKGERKRLHTKIRIAPDEARPLLMKVRQQEEERFVKVNAVDIDLEWWLVE